MPHFGSGQWFGRVTNNTSGTLTLSGNNTSRGTTISSIVSQHAFNTGSTSSSIGTGSLTLNGGTLRFDGTSGGRDFFDHNRCQRWHAGYNLAGPTYSYIFYNARFRLGHTQHHGFRRNSNQWLFTAASSGFTGNINIATARLIAAGCRCVV